MVALGLRKLEKAVTSHVPPSLHVSKYPTSSFNAVLRRIAHHVVPVLATQDEALKNLMMSWYWAGYYTGLYEGQQGQGKQPCNQDVNGDAKGG